MEWVILAVVVVFVVIGGGAVWASRSKARTATTSTPQASLKKVAPSVPVDSSRVIRDQQHRFELDSPLPDMTCGNNGVPLQQVFRPTYFTAEWNSGVLSEVRIWGPRVLKNGSLGSRLLDHCWNQQPVNLEALPGPVASQIRSCEASGF